MKNNQTNKQFQAGRYMRGLSLVELMVAMAISLVLLIAVGYVYMGSRQTFRAMDDFSRVQENYRYAIDQIGNDVRMGGFTGCVNVSSIDPANPGNIPVQPPANATNPNSLALARAVQGYAGAGAWPGPAPAPANYVASTDVLRVTTALGQGTNVTGPMPAAGGAIPVNGNPANIASGVRLVISDCTTAEIFTAGVVAANSVTPAAPLSKIYSTGAEVYPFMDTVYFIGTNPAGNPSLYRRQNAAAAEELVENVERMVLRFGVDTNTPIDYAANAYQDSATVADWRRVQSVRVNLVFRGNTNATTDAASVAATYTVEGTTTNPGDHRLRQMATATYGIRNRLP